jgi:hypothetical protein
MTEQDEDYMRRRRTPHESIIMGAAPHTCGDQARLASSGSVEEIWDDDYEQMSGQQR